MSCCPAIRPAVAIATTLGIVNGLRIFDQIMALTGGGPSGATETLATQVYKQAFSLGNFSYGAALALILTLIILVFAILQQRVTQSGPRRPDMFRYTKLTLLREILLWVLAAVFLLPFYFLVTIALKPDSEIYTTSAVAPPKEPTLRHFGAAASPGRATPTSSAA